MRWAPRRLASRWVRRAALAAAMWEVQVHRAAVVAAIRAALVHRAAVVAAIRAALVHRAALAAAIRAALGRLRRSRSQHWRVEQVASRAAHLQQHHLAARPSRQCSAQPALGTGASHCTETLTALWALQPPTRLPWIRGTSWRARHTPQPMAHHGLGRQARLQQARVRGRAATFRARGIATRLARPWEPARTALCPVGMPRLLRRAARPARRPVTWRMLGPLQRGGRIIQRLPTLRTLRRLPTLRTSPLWMPMARLRSAPTRKRTAQRLIPLPRLRLERRPAPRAGAIADTGARGAPCRGTPRCELCPVGTGKCSMSTARRSTPTRPTAPRWRPLKVLDRQPQHPHPTP
jgi:hypothetical protein